MSPVRDKNVSKTMNIMLHSQVELNRNFNMRYGNA